MDEQTTPNNQPSSRTVRTVRTARGTRVSELELGELHRIITDLIQEYGPDIPVRILSNDWSPWELELKGIETASEECPVCDGDNSDCDACDGNGEITRAYITTGDQIRYAPDSIKALDN